MYVLAYSMVRGDEQPSGAERIYLAQLANLLGIDREYGATARTDRREPHRRSCGD